MQRPRQIRLTYIEWTRKGSSLFNDSDRDKWMFICPLCYSVFFMIDFREFAISGLQTPRICIADNGNPCIPVPEEEWIDIMPMEIHFGDGGNTNSIKILDFYYPEMVIAPNDRIWKGGASTYEQEAKYNRS